MHAMTMTAGVIFLINLNGTTTDAMIRPRKNPKVGSWWRSIMYGMTRDNAPMTTTAPTPKAAKKGTSSSRHAVFQRLTAPSG